MTWATWIDSSCNTDGFDSNGNYVMDGSSNYITKGGNVREELTDVITASSYYIHR